MLTGRTPQFITRDRRMLLLLEEVRRAAASPVPVLLAGESGVGKEIVGRLIHRWSARPGPFVAVNAASLGGDLVESALFGHARGAFTGAVRRGEGFAAAASRGTLFLDEIGELDGGAQSRLLRFLDDGEFIPVGETRARRSDARIVAATNRDLAAAAGRGEFRPDLYYRLAGISFLIPPLRERPGDIAPIADHIIRRTAADLGLREARLSPAASRALVACRWPGNVRQLRNELVGAIVRTGGGVIEASDLSAEVAGCAAGGAEPAAATLDERIRNLERREILEALRRTASNCSRAAELLGLRRTTLIYRMRRHGIVLREKGGGS
ncbi:MAG: sigma 54-interacting transcriptional regulator [Candidatus Krumholzibacteria bacterium]|nr:sigma 54-interacting transcriptional regulator [Candidatus Krumholzibacteria bacterium]